MKNMGKKLLGLLLALCLPLSAAAAEEDGLPQEVLGLCAAAHPGYAVSQYDGWGDGAWGQFALILSKDGDNILCIAEKEDGDAAYALTVDNTNAVRDGGILPSLLIDTGGDSLFYTYSDEHGGSAHYGSVKENGVWGTVSVITYWQNDSGISGMHAGVWDGALRYEETDEDENENIRESWNYPPIPVDVLFEQAMKLARFDIEAFDANPTDGVYPTDIPGFAESWRGDGSVIEAIDLSRSHAALVVRQADGGCALKIGDWDGRQMDWLDRAYTIPANSGLDSYHAGEGQVYVTRGDMLYILNRNTDSAWYPVGVQGENVLALGADCAGERTIPGRNDGMVYGDAPWDADWFALDKLPVSLDKAIAMMDTSAYALVNNPDPQDRLHLRAKADRGADSYGKFYNRTPVRILERGDTWTKVRIGSGANTLTGYMMTQYLAFGEADKAAVACAFPQKQLMENGKDGALQILSAPDGGAETCGAFEYRTGDYIIGVCGDGWYIVLRADGTAGYVPQDMFWDGNG